MSQQVSIFVWLKSQIIILNFLPRKLVKLKGNLHILARMYTNFHEFFVYYNFEIFCHFLIQNLLRHNLLKRKMMLDTKIHYFRFLKMYGYKFSKEDHVALVNLLMSMLLTPELDPFLINRTVNNLISLMKKKELLTPSDLQIQWRPLYELYEKLFYSPYEALGMLHYPR